MQGSRIAATHRVKIEVGSLACDVWRALILLFVIQSILIFNASSFRWSVIGDTGFPFLVRFRLPGGHCRRLRD